MTLAVFVVLSAVCVAAVAAMILSRNPADNALFLVVAFAALGGLFGLLDSPFAAVAQVLVYAGAIMVLFLFAVMMFDLRRLEPRSRKRVRLGLASALAALLLAELALAGIRISGLAGPAWRSAEARDMARLGRLLFTDYLYPLEISALLLMAAIAGALALAGRKDAG